MATMALRKASRKSTVTTKTTTSPTPTPTAPSEVVAGLTTAARANSTIVVVEGTAVSQAGHTTTQGPMKATEEALGWLLVLRQTVQLQLPPGPASIIAAPQHLPVITGRIQQEHRPQVNYQYG